MPFDKYFPPTRVATQIVNADYGLFCQSNIGSETYQPNPHSSINPDHLNFFKFCGIAQHPMLYTCHMTLQRSAPGAFPCICCSNVVIELLDVFHMFSYFVSFFSCIFYHCVSMKP